MLKRARFEYAAVVMLLLSGATSALAQAPPAGGRQAAPTTPAPGPSAAVTPDYVIGPEDVIGIVFWREAEMSGDVTVRPDGLITLPLVGDVRAAGLRPDALREEVHKAATKFLKDLELDNVTIAIRQINSRKVYITGEVRSAGQYPLTGPRTVAQLIALAGGLAEYADKKNIQVLRGSKSFRVNYEEIEKGKRLEQNIQLQPGDTVVVP